LRTRVSLFGLLLASTAGAIFLFVYPLAIIQPFKRQDPVQLRHALSVVSAAPRGTIFMAFVAAVAVALLWGRVRMWGRIAGMLLLLLTCVAAALSHINVFEQMFHPAGSPKFVSIHDAKIDPEDMLIAVSLTGQAHAYPIREMAYHHVVNDWFGDVPIVATY
jgi:hypothetical protein